MRLQKARKVSLLTCWFASLEGIVKVALHWQSLIRGHSKKWLHVGKVSFIGGHIKNLCSQGPIEGHSKNESTSARLSVGGNL